MNVKEAIEAAWDGADSVKQACDRAMRYMTKELLKNLTLEWRKIG